MAPLTQEIVNAGQRAYEVGLQIGKNAVWADEPVTQIATNLVVVVAAALSSAVTWVVGLLIAGIALVLLTVGVVRLTLQLYRGQR